MKIRKNHSKKRYRYNVNRKTLNRTRKNTGTISDPYLKKMWEEYKRPNKNFREMGLSSDPNKTVPIPSYKQSRLNIAKIVNKTLNDDSEDEEIMTKAKKKMKEAQRVPKKGFVVEKLESDAKAPREKGLRLPKGIIEQLTYFLDKYQYNFKAMAGDRKNYDQWTWKRFRTKIHQFQSIPEQWNVYLKSKNLEPGNALPWTEYDSDSEWR